MYKNVEVNKIKNNKQNKTNKITPYFSNRIICGYPLRSRPELPDSLHRGSPTADAVLHRKEGGGLGRAGVASSGALLHRWAMGVEVGPGSRFARCHALVSWQGRHSWATVKWDDAIWIHDIPIYRLIKQIQQSLFTNHHPLQLWSISISHHYDQSSLQPLLVVTSR